MTTKQPRPKTCKICREKFTPIRPLQSVCGFDCAIATAKKTREVKERKEHREAKVKLKSRADWLKEAQAIFNQYIRLRDEKEPCISCGRFHEGQYHAGHYLTTGAHPELRFNELNVHKQCAPCNNFLSGNIIKYRQNLINKIGLQQVLFLEGPHEPLKLTIDEIKDIKSLYRQKIKEFNEAQT